MFITACPYVIFFQKNNQFPFQKTEKLKYEILTIVVPHFTLNSSPLIALKNNLNE